MATAAPAVFITVPKYVAITPSALPKIRPAIAVAASAIHSAQAAAMSPSSSGYASSGGGTDLETSAPRGKKRRLDHLTWEEKVQRKKLKNRVAAQTSRDRKKARMEEMESEIDDLTQKTELLQNKCESLQAINDSLLAKNQKLDMEVESLRQQLAELQKEHSAAAATQPAAVAACAGSGLTSNGLTVSTRAEKELHTSGSLEDCGALPNLQDMLLFDEEFDAGKLEELAESLLADITADMETGVRECDEVAAEVASGAERLSGSVVGTTAERMESSEHSSPAPECPPRGASIDGPLRGVVVDADADAGSTITPVENNLTLQHELQQPKQSANEKTTTHMGKATQVTRTTAAATATPDTVYGTYDAKTNSITIVMGDDTVAVNEAVEEIYCDGETPPTDADAIKCPTPMASPSQVYLNVEGSDDEDDDLNFDPIAKFLCPKRPLVSPLAKSPAPSLHSATSDHGYESILGSPTTTAMDHFEAGVDDFAWSSSFNELFPTLI